MDIPYNIYGVMMVGMTPACPAVIRNTKPTLGGLVMRLIVGGPAYRCSSRPSCDVRSRPYLLVACKR